ncbi:hypothetical protein [Brevundimonas nasdae]|uniref:hypothetical protein n=1 Tax=Brevundimonas nasdae TaxID=172043 RepID=UPI003F68C449
MNKELAVQGPAAVLSNPKVVRFCERALVVGSVAVLVTTSAIAGTDNTFDSTVSQLTNWTEGSLGKLAGVAGVAVALVGMVMKFDWRLIGGAAGIGLTAATGPGIVSALASATF